MKTKRNKLTILALALALATLAGAATAGPILIANTNVPENSLSANQVQKIFLGKTAQWSDGTRIQLSALKKGDLSAAFLRTYVKKSQKQFLTFWKKAVFSGTGEMPGVFDTEADMVVHVSKTPGAVGYIDEATPHDGVKVITIN